MMSSAKYLVVLVAMTSVNAFKMVQPRSSLMRVGVQHRSAAIKASTIAMDRVESALFKMSDKKEKEPEKEGFARLSELLEKADKDPKKGPPIYEPGSYPTHLLAALAYVIPIADAADMGKYMFQAYPDVGAAFSTVFGPIVALYNGVPFLPFAIFFLMSYICRAPTFPVEIRFHVAQAFMLSIIQFVPSVLFGLLEKGGVQGMGVLYNTVFLWVMASSLIMQFLLLNPIAETKNPFIVNVVGWSMRYMNYSPDMAPKK